MEGGTLLEGRKWEMNWAGKILKKKKEDVKGPPKFSRWSCGFCIAPRFCARMNRSIGKNMIDGKEKYLLVGAL